MAVPQGWEWKKLDPVLLMPEGVQLNFHRVSSEETWIGQFSSVCLDGVTWENIAPTCAGLHPMLLIQHPSLHCFPQAETLPNGVCALLSVHQHDRKDSCHCCPWLWFKSIQCHCKFYGTIFIGEFGQNAVVQLINTNCWFWHTCAQNDLVVI